MDDIEDLEAPEQTAEAIDLQQQSPLTSPQILPPPPLDIYDLFDELLAFLQRFHRDHNAAVRIARSANPREVNGQRIKTYYVLVCDRAGPQTSTSTGLRRTST